MTPLSLIPLAMRVVYTATGVRDYRIGGLTASQDYVFGFFDVCTSPNTAGNTYPDPTVAGQISLQRECISYEKLCSAVRYQTQFDAGPFIDKEFCGSRFKTAMALEIIAAAVGTVVVILLIDNALVWLNRSCWYHPKRHLVSEVDCVRRTFKVVVILNVFSHGALQAFAMGILFDLQRNRITWPTGLDFHWGIFVQGISWAADILFILLFLFFDRLTFFVNVDWDFEDPQAAPAPMPGDDEAAIGSPTDDTQTIQAAAVALSGGSYVYHHAAASAAAAVAAAHMAVGAGSSTDGAAVKAIVAGGPVPPAPQAPVAAAGRHRSNAHHHHHHTSSSSPPSSALASSLSDGGVPSMTQVHGSAPHTPEQAAAPVLAMVGGSRIDAVAIQVIRGGK
ncbi:hypothetical protein HDU96_005966 [Phlyctochytrium bullatum]|nr:hypothetical protein HDU96_005966 [Phlyctochytrium bullatum]